MAKRKVILLRIPGIIFTLVYYFLSGYQEGVKKGSIINKMPGPGRYSSIHRFQKDR